MQLSSITDYAIRILVYLSHKKGYASTDEISQQMELTDADMKIAIKELEAAGYISVMQENQKKRMLGLKLNVDKIDLYQINCLEDNQYNRTVSDSAYVLSDITEKVVREVLSMITIDVLSKE